MNKSLEQYMPDGSKVPYRFMKYRIHKILLVCCSYDGYILEEDRAHRIADQPGVHRPQHDRTRPR